MKIRYQADRDLNEAIVSAVKRQEPTIDFQLAGDARSGQGLDAVPDGQVLAEAAKEGRILVTHDQRTMPYHFGDFIANNECPGVFIISQDMDIGPAMESLVLAWAASEAEEWINRIIRIE